ncbi:MAG: hypothetical protein AB8C84_06985 [Oligoflexales bacterium]
MKFILLTLLTLKGSLIMANTAQNFLQISKTGVELDLDVELLKRPDSQFQKNLKKVGLTPTRQKKAETYLNATTSASYAKMLEQTLTSSEMNILCLEANKISPIFEKYFKYSQELPEKRLNQDLTDERKRLIKGLLEESRDHEIYPGLPLETCISIFASKYENLSDTEIISLTKYFKNDVIKKERATWIKFHQNAMAQAANVFAP